jgi:uncharacterized protein (DUF2147 family)
MIRALRVLLLGAFIAAPAAAAQAAADPAFGQWLNADGAGKITVGPCAADPALACGAITWIKDAAAHPRDENNPDRALRNRPIIGVLAVRDMKNEGPGRWTGGKLYDPESGKTYNGKLKVLSTTRLQVTGCVLMLCESQIWTRP